METLGISEIRLETDLLTAVGTGEDLRAGLAEAFTILRGRGGLAGLEWWTPRDQLALAEGSAVGPKTEVPVGAAGTLVLIGEVTAGVTTAVSRLGLLLNYRWIAEQLAEQAARLARRNEALEDLSVLVAHDVKSILLSAADADQPRETMKRALDVVDTILDAALADQAERSHAPVAESVQQAAADLGDLPAEVVTSVNADFPMPPAALRLILRNLLGNAVAAGAQRVDIRSRAYGDRSVLIVDNDGARLGTTDRYATGTQLGLALCRRLVARCGGVLDLKPGPLRGARAVIQLTGAGE